MTKQNSVQDVVEEMFQSVLESVAEFADGVLTLKVCR